MSVMKGDRNLLSAEGRKEMFYLTTHSTHFIYGYMASDIWLRIILIVRKETRCRHIGYSFRLAERVLLYASSHRQDNTYHGLCCTSRGALPGTVHNTCNTENSTWMIFFGLIFLIFTEIANGRNLALETKSDRP